MVSWHPATGARGGHVVGVNAGNVAIADARTALAIGSGDKDRTFERYASGAPSVLLVDFLVIAEFIDRRIAVELEDGAPARSAELAAQGTTLALRIGAGQVVLTVGAEQPSERGPTRPERRPTTTAAASG